MILSPSLYNAGVCHLEQTLSDIEKAGAQYLHVDILDNTFVPSLSFGPKIVKDLKKMTDLVLDVHMMVDTPENCVADFCQAGADIVTVHYEATSHLGYTIQEIKKHHVKVGVAINPATPVCVIEPVLQDVDQVLVMTINPGRSGQKLILSTLDKIRELVQIRNAKNLHFDIQVDGNITPDNVEKVLDAGANVIVSGGGIFNEHPICENIQKFFEVEK